MEYYCAECAKRLRPNITNELIVDKEGECDRCDNEGGLYAFDAIITHVRKPDMATPFDYLRQVAGSPVPH